MKGGLHSAPHSVTRSVVTVVRIADPHAAHAVHGRHPAPAGASISIQSDSDHKGEVPTMPEVRADKGDAARADEAARPDEAACADEAARADKVTGTHSTTAATATVACVGFSEGDHENRRHRCGE